jgi:hypothetical protein
MLIAEKEYEKQKTYFKKIKKACNNVISDLTEMIDMKTPDFIELLGLESDIEQVKRLKNKI